MSDALLVDASFYPTPTLYRCPAHGEVAAVITSTIPGHEGAWCQLCWLASLGPPIPRVETPQEAQGRDRA